MVYCCRAQNKIFIRGRITDQQDKPVFMALVSLVHTESVSAIAFAGSNESGNFEIVVNATPGTYTIKINILGYREMKEIISITDSTSFIRNYKLTPAVTSLQEVVVKSSVPGVTVKGDTTTFKTKRFANGTEKNVEDLLKKLPGVKVAENGDISFKGKKIDGVYLDGDDLLGKNYKLATRNINAGYVSEVQALEKFSSNSLLKGIENSDKTVLNLKIDSAKKNIVFGSADVAWGNNNFHDAGINLFSYSKKAKLYVLGGSNTVGRNSHPDDYRNPEVERIADDEPLVAVDPLISTERSYPPGFNESRVNFNNEYLGSLLGTYKPDDKLSFQYNISYVNDRNSQNLSSIDKYTVLNKQFFIAENSLLTNKLQLFNIDFHAAYKIDFSSTLKYSFSHKLQRSVASQQIISSGDSIQNANILQDIGTRLTFDHQQINYVKRINLKSAVVFNINYFHTGTPQTLQLSGDNALSNALLKGAGINQATNVSVNEVAVDLKYLGAARKLKYFVESGVYYDRQRFDSNQILQTKAYADSLDFASEIKRLNTTDGYIKAGSNYSLKKFKVTAEIGLHYFEFANDSTNEAAKHHYLYVEPMLSVVYGLGDLSKFTAAYSLNRRYSAITDLFTNYIITDYRSLVTGLDRINLQENSIYRLSYNYDDFYNQFNLAANLFYLNRVNAYGNGYDITPAFDISSKFIMPQSSIKAFSFQLDKFVSALSSNVRINIDYGINTYFDKLNTNSLRKNFLKAATYKFTYTTVFNSKFNFAAGLSYQHNKVKTSTEDTVSHAGTDFSNIFLNVIYKSKNLLITVSPELPVVNNSPYFFLDVSAKYFLIGNKLSLIITGKNLTGKTSYKQIYINDYEYNVVNYKLLPRYVLVGFNYSF